MNATTVERPVLALQGFWHQHATVLIVEPLQILAVLIIALVVRAVGHRAIDKISRPTAEGHIPRILSPLTERAVQSTLLESSGLLSERRRQRAETIGSVAKSAVSFIVVLFAILIVLDRIGLNLAPFIAGTSLIGVAVGFGAQNIVKDFLAGIFMIMEDQYGVGDVIDVKEATGTVEAVGLRTTRLRDTAGTVWYMRNGEIVRVGNQSQGFAQVVIDVPIATADDLSAARAAMAEAATSLYTDPAWSQRFLDEPVILGVESLGREETLVRITARVRPLEQWRTARELRGRIRLALDAAGIPPRDLDPNRTVPDGPDPDSAASAPTPSPTPS